MAKRDGKTIVINSWNETCSTCAIQSKILASASINEPSLRKGNTGNIESASKVGELIAERAIEKGIKEVAFDRSGYKYHGRVKALAESARKSGLTF